MCLAHAGRAEHEDVGLLELDIVGALVGPDPLVVVVNGNAEDLLGLLLAHDVVFELPVERLGIQAPGHEVALGGLCGGLL